MSRRVVVALLAPLALVAVLAVLAVAGARPAGADNCSTDADCEQTGGYNGIIAVVGGVAAVAAAAVAAVAATPKGEETDLAIVQVSEDRLEVSTGQPAQLTLTGWHVGTSGTPERVAMPLRIEVPPSSGVRVTPIEGVGELVANVEVDEETLPEGTEEVELVTRGVWRGKEATATVTVHIGEGYELRLR